MDTVLLNKIIRGIGKYIPGAQISIGYTVQDPRPSQLKMLERVIRIIAEYADVPEAEINENTDIRADLGLNSLELVNLAVEIEEEFDVEIPDREAMGLETVEDAIHIIEEYME